MKIQTIEGERLHSGIPTLVGTIAVGHLMGRYQIPERKNNKGYQRELNKGRVQRLAQSMREESVDLPTAILMNRRDLDMEQCRSQGGNSRCIPISKEQDHLQDFYIVDGQHRVRALEILFLEDNVKWANFPIPFVCMIGAGEEQEMEQFYVVNTNAKSVKTDLSMDLLREMAKDNPRIRKILEMEKKEWKVTGQELVDELRKSPVWAGRIRYPGDDKGNTTIGNGSVASSFRDVLKQVNFISHSFEQQGQILDAYWQGIRMVYPEAFADNKVRSYNLQKTLGVGVFHNLFPYVLQLASQRSGIFDKQVYANIMRSALERLELLNGHDEPVSGLDCWKTGEEGAMAGFSSGAGRQRLAEKIRDLLPPLDIR